MLSQPVNTDRSSPFFFSLKGLDPLDKKIIAVSVATFLFFPLQMGMSLGTTFLIANVNLFFTMTSPKAYEDWTFRRVGKMDLLSFFAFPVIFGQLIRSMSSSAPEIIQPIHLQMYLLNPLRFFTMVVIVAPIAEEILFRGFLSERIDELIDYLNFKKIVSLSDQMKEKVCNFSQSLIFGICHIFHSTQKMLLLISTTLMGYTFEQLKVKYKNISVPMALHSGQNFSAFLAFRSHCKNFIG